jgi:hypothetical protein
LGLVSSAEFAPTPLPVLRTGSVLPALYTSFGVARKGRVSC